jgi:hypothetical protein
MDAFKFADLCRTMLNIDRDQLEAAGVLTPGKTDDGGTSWKRWNDEPFIFVAKLDDDRVQKLWALLQAQNPKATAAPSLQQQVSDYIELTETLRGARVYVDTARQAAAHQSLRPVLEHTKAVLAQIDKALNDIGAPPEPKEPRDGKAQ